MKTKTHKETKVKVITMGCSKNLVDSENIITQLQHQHISANHENFQEESNIIIVNTCGFIEAAKQESINAILENVELKKRGKIEKLYVTGCLSERNKSELSKEIPEVDAYFGTMELPGLLSKFDVDYKHELIGERKIATPSHYAYLKISEGCNRTCSFCAIPLMRGKHISKPMDEIIREASNLAHRGVREVMLIAQELTYYGLDIYKKRMLRKLLQELCQVDGIEWIRLHYAYPSRFPTEILETIGEEKKICNYLDLPLQHADNFVLKRMRRQITRKETEELLDEIRTVIPDIALRTTLMVGFPGETKKEFETLKKFVLEQEFDRMGVFTYSHEEGTTAFEYEDNVPDQLKKERADELMEIQEGISYRKNQALIGTQFLVLVDKKEGNDYIGRTEFDSPEVDNEVIIDAENQYLRIGDFANVQIGEAEAYDLFGTVVGGVEELRSL